MTIKIIHSKTYFALFISGEMRTVSQVELDWPLRYRFSQLDMGSGCYIYSMTMILDTHAKSCAVLFTDENGEPVLLSEASQIRLIYNHSLHEIICCCGI